MTAPLHIRGLTKRYASRTILSSVDLQVGPGEAVALRGPNGVGKTTLLGCVVGNVIPDEGEIAIGGHDLAAAPLQARAAMRYLPQEVEAPPGLTGRELLSFFADVYGDPEGLEVATGWLRLGEALDRLVTTYSVGMRRQLGFASLLPGAPALIVLDEPFAGVDADGRARMRETLAAAKERGAGLLMAAHDQDLADVEALGARELVLEAPEA